MLEIPEKCETLLQQLVADAKRIGERNAGESRAKGGNISAGHFPAHITTELMGDILKATAPSLCINLNLGRCSWTNEACRQIQEACAGDERLYLAVKARLGIKLMDLVSATLQEA